jgi:hypothetical protein
MTKESTQSKKDSKSKKADDKPKSVADIVGIQTDAVKTKQHGTHHVWWYEHKAHAKDGTPYEWAHPTDDSPSMKVGNGSWEDVVDGFGTDDLDRLSYLMWTVAKGLKDGTLSLTKVE